ncbi:hypothetical protein [Arthrobacter sp. JSM 101049]|uniref:hypothetical protein n=1 Tax=Arthrobacter sp. JSM 101049 TaxID=929097 RepID=UPI003568584B
MAGENISAGQIEVAAQAIRDTVKLSIRPNGGTMEMLEQGHTFHLTGDEAKAAAAAAYDAFHPTVATRDELDALQAFSIIADGRLPFVRGKTGAWRQIGTSGAVDSRWLAAVLADGKAYTVLHRGGDSR